MNLNRVDRLYVDIDATATLSDGTPASITDLDVALLPSISTPTGATTWTPATADGDVWQVLLAGPDADPDGALVVPSGGAVLWIRVTDAPEVDVARVERITVS